MINRLISRSERSKAAPGSFLFADSSCSQRDYWSLGTQRDADTQLDNKTNIHAPPAMIFFLIPVFSSNFPRKSVTTFFSFRNLSARSLMDEKMSSRPMVLSLVLDLDPNQVFNQVLSRPSITFSEHTKGSKEDDLRL